MLCKWVAYFSLLCALCFSARFVSSKYRLERRSSYSSKGNKAKMQIRVFLPTVLFTCTLIISRFNTSSGSVLKSSTNIDVQTKMMKIVEIKSSQKAHPFGDERTVDQAFPGAISAENADPFLMGANLQGIYQGH